MGWGCRQRPGRALTLQSRGWGCVQPPPAAPALAPQTGAASAGEVIGRVGGDDTNAGGWGFLLASLLAPPVLAGEVGTDR